MTIQRAFIAALQSRTFAMGVGNLNSAGSFDTTTSFNIYRNGSCDGFLGSWTLPLLSTIGDGYDVRVNASSLLGLSGPALNTWHALTTTRTWSLFNTVDGTTLETDLTVEVRVTGGGATVCSETFTMSAEVYP